MNGFSKVRRARARMTRGVVVLCTAGMLLAAPGIASAAGAKPSPPGKAYQPISGGTGHKVK